MKNISTPILVLLVALWIVLFDNASFFKHLINVYPLNETYIPFNISVTLVTFLFYALALLLLSWKYITKPILIILLILAAVENYFMQTYNILIDKTMIENTVQTDIHEALDLMNWKIFAYLIILGLLPSYFVYNSTITYKSFQSEIFSKLKWVMSIVVIIILLMLPFSKHYTSFLREHKTIRFYSNPAHGLFSLGSYIKAQLKDKNVPIKQIGLDAKIDEKRKKRVVIMVVGEAARADHFSLNGYNKETNPLLKKENIINFSNIYSCGTTTAVSVPCMFSIYDKSDYSTNKGLHTENVVDVLDHAGVDVIWRDNNSNSKGVADRVTYQYYKDNTHNTLCKDECRDEGMLIGLDKIIEESQKDLLIILHQMGNHGPAYYKRYPKEFEIFTPTCQTNQLEACTQEEISNAYDNALRYTDYFLSKTINLLKKYEGEMDTAMYYMADHGESLGENGMYLHGIPYFIAPDHQKHVASVVWLGKNFSLNQKAIKLISNKKFSQDNLFSTLLGLFDVQSSIYEKEMDIFNVGRE